MFIAARPAAALKVQIDSLAGMAVGPNATSVATLHTLVAKRSTALDLVIRVVRELLA